jgi:hypothetical protein
MPTDLKSGDVIQGTIGDCWFISSMSIIAQDDKYLRGQNLKDIPTANLSRDIASGIHPPIFEGFRKFGIYVFKYFKNYKPIYVVVDDLIPVQIGNTSPLFAHNP